MLSISHHLGKLSYILDNIGILGLSSQKIIDDWASFRVKEVVNISFMSKHIEENSFTLESEFGVEILRFKDLQDSFHTLVFSNYFSVLRSLDEVSNSIN